MNLIMYVQMFSIIKIVPPVPGPPFGPRNIMRFGILRGKMEKYASGFGVQISSRVTRPGPVNGSSPAFDLKTLLVRLKHSVSAELTHHIPWRRLLDRFPLAFHLLFQCQWALLV